MGNPELNANGIHQEWCAADERSNCCRTIRIVDDTAFPQISGISSAMIAEPNVQTNRRIALA